MKFGFYRKNDANKEIIRTKTAKDLQQAVEFFAAIKGLTVEQFLDIFAITTMNQSK